MAEATRHLELSCFPHRGEPTNPRLDRVAVIVTDITDAVRAEGGVPETGPTPRQLLEQLAERVRGLAGSGAAADVPGAAASVPGVAVDEAVEALRTAAGEVERLTGLIEEFETARGELLDANHQLTGANALLRTENQELLFGNEEAQAAVEEIETLNEEQQATNEELETLNEELQATVEELNTTNDDMEARGMHVEQAAVQLGAERGRLSAVLAAMPDAVLVVDAQERVVRANAAFERYFGADGDGLRPEDDQGHPLDGRATPRARAARGESFIAQFSQARPDHSRRWYEATGHPIQSTAMDGGGVLVIRDITDRRARS